MKRKTGVKNYFPKPAASERDRTTPTKRTRTKRRTSREEDEGGRRKKRRRATLGVSARKKRT
jgi:hypothetical protein